jgi:hypothetical protein
MHRQFADLAEFEPNAIDSTCLDPQATAEFVRAGLAAGTFLLPPG